VRRADDPASGYGDCEELVAYFVADCWRTGRTAVPLPRCYKCKPTRQGQRTCTNCGNVVRNKRVNVAGDTWHIQALLRWWSRCTAHRRHQPRARHAAAS